MDMISFIRSYSSAVKFMAQGKHGTPDWNPTPHPEADLEQVAKRDTDPLWGYHRGLIGYSGYPLETANDKGMEGSHKGYNVLLHSQSAPSTPTEYSFNHTRYGPDSVDHTETIPPGLATLEELRYRQGQGDADLQLTRNAHIDPEHGGELDAFHPANNPRHANLWGGNAGRRPWYDTLFPLQDLIHHSEPHDPYRLLAASVRSGNRHALPHLVNLLQKRDNPGGWYSGWGALARAMEERTGDLSAHEVFRRAHAIATASAKHSQDPEGHGHITNGIEEGNADRGVLPGHSGDGVPEPELTGYGALADHMEENGLPQYAQLLRTELANVLPQFRKAPRRKGSRL